MKLWKRTWGEKMEKDLNYNEEDLEKVDSEEAIDAEIVDDENVEEAVDEVALLNEQLLRLRADFANYKRRAEEDKLRAASYGVEKLAVDLLGVVDNFERALDSKDGDDSFYQGVKMINEQLIGVLNKHDILEIDAKDKDFDPNFHHAVLTEAVEGMEAGKVLDVLQKGYTLKDRVIRPAMVKVTN